MRPGDSIKPFSSIKEYDLKCFHIADDDVIERALSKAILICEAQAKRNCPVDTGRLRQSIVSEVSREPDSIVGTVGTNVEYAPYVEFGTGLFSSLGTGRKDVPWHYKDVKGQWHTTSGQHPQPFLIPAYQQTRDSVQKTFTASIIQEIKTYGQ